jgi:hypothetical protein
VGRISARPVNAQSSISSRRSALALACGFGDDVSSWSATAARPAAVGDLCGLMGRRERELGLLGVEVVERAWRRVSRSSLRSGESVPCSSAS